jgi:ABC-type phosphate/phosphonate transport system substrate-binding protein
MYDWPEVRAETEAWWNGIARHAGIDAPLTHLPWHMESWSRPDLVFSQTCGYPFTHEFKGKLKLVATPHYDVDGCSGPNYCSMVFARENRPLADYRDLRAAENNADSMSGMLALQILFAPLAQQGRFFGAVIESGGHVRSLLAVRDGTADICAIDAVCVALARRYRPDYLEGLVEIGRSPLVPSLPYVTVSGDPAHLREALAAAFADPRLAKIRERLFLKSFSHLDERAYQRIVDLERTMQQAGGLKLL